MTHLGLSRTKDLLAALGNFFCLFFLEDAYWTKTTPEIFQKVENNGRSYWWGTAVNFYITI